MPTDKQRRETERRRLQRQAERRRERALRRRRYNIIGSIVGALVIIAVIVFVVVQTNDDSSDTASSPTPTPTATPSASASTTVKPYPCTWTKTAAAASKVVIPPSTTVPSKTGTTVVKAVTNRGTLTFALNRAKAPCAVESFVSLAAQKYFDNTSCSRLVSGSLNVLQCGDPTGTGTGGPGYSFADELTGTEKYTTGVLAMANSGANTNGSQFFIVYKDSTLNPAYTVFGTVTAGLPIVDKIAAGGDDGSSSAGGGKPKLKLTFTSVRSTS